MCPDPNGFGHIVWDKTNNKGHVVRTIIIHGTANGRSDFESDDDQISTDDEDSDSEDKNFQLSSIKDSSSSISTEDENFSEEDDISDGYEEDDSEK